MIRATPRRALVLLATVAATACNDTDSSSADNTASKESRAPKVAERSLVAGATLELRAATALSSRTNHAGDRVVATLRNAALTPAGDTVIPAGAQFIGNVTSIAPAENPREAGTLQVALVNVRFGGKTRPIHMRVSSMATTMQGRGVTPGDVGKVGVGAVAGGIAGRVIGGNRTGTIVGAAAGTAAGAVIANRSRDIDIVLPAGGMIRVVLSQDFQRDVVM